MKSYAGIRKHVVFRCIVFIYLMLIITGCNQSLSSKVASRLDAEETGYLTALSSASASSTCRGIVENINDWRKYNTLNDDRKKSKSLTNLNSGIRNLTLKAKNNLQKVKKSLPPHSLSDIHSKRISLFNYMVGVGENISSDNYVKIEKMCLDYYKMNKQWESVISSRKPKKNTEKTLKLSYQPGIIPIAYNTISGFIIQQSFTAPFGKITASYANAGGAKLLVIRSNGVERYFSLGIPFEVFVPSNYGVTVSGDGKGKLVINVVNK